MASEAEWSNGSAPTEVPPKVMTGLSYRPALTEVDGPARTLLQKWSEIPADKVVQHVNDLRDRAYKLYPYASIGLFTFLDLDLPLFPHYNEIVERVKKGDNFLDLGCCFAQEVRQLVSEGAPAENVYGADLSRDMMNLGYELFLDKGKLNSRFIAADIFDDQSTLAKEFTGRLDIIHASKFFHLWEWEKQIDAAKRVVKLLAGRPGSMIFGTQTGSRPARNLIWSQVNKLIFMQSAATWKQLWSKVSQDTGIQFEVEITEATYPDQAAFGWPEDLDLYRMFYTIRRVS